MLAPWIAMSILFAGPVILGMLSGMEQLWRRNVAEGSEEEARRARDVVALGAIVVVLLVVFAALPFVRTVISEVTPPGGDPIEPATLGWLILLVGLALPYAALAVCLLAEPLSPRLRGMALVLGRLPIWLVALALGALLVPVWTVPLLVLYLTSATGLFVLGLGLLAAVGAGWVAVATGAFVRGPSEDARRRASGARGTTVWLAGIVASALLMGAWEPEYRPPTRPADRQLPVVGAPAASIAWATTVEGGTSCLLPYSPAVDTSGTVYVPLWDGLVALSGEGQVLWKRVELRPSKPLRTRSGGGVFVVTDGIIEEGEPRTVGSLRQLVEILPDGSTGGRWPYVETPLPRAEGGFYSRTRNHLVAVGPDGTEEWRARLRLDQRPLGRLFYDAAGNVVVAQRYDRIHVVAPDGEVTRTLVGLDAEPPQSWIPGVPYPLPGPGGSFVSWDGELIAVRPPGDTLWRRDGYAPGVAPAPDGSLRAVREVERGQIFLFGLDSLGLPSWRHPLVPADVRWARVSAGPVVGNDGASLLVVRGRAIAVNGDGTLRWIGEPLPWVEGTYTPLAWGPGGRAYVVRKRYYGRDGCAAVVALEPPERSYSRR